jgi:HEAT repeat protein
MGSIEALFKVVQTDSDSRLREGAVMALRWIGDSQAFEPLLKYLKELRITRRWGIFRGIC